MTSHALSKNTDNDLYKLYNEQRSFFWTEDEINFSKDLDDWEKILNNEKKHFFNLFYRSIYIVMVLYVRI